MFLSCIKTTDWLNDHSEWKEIFVEEYENLLTYINEYLANAITYLSKNFGVEPDFMISEALLKQAVISALDDLIRIENYHDSIPNPIKRSTYLAFWLVRHKPILLINEEILDSSGIEDVTKAKILFINEQFCVQFLIGSLFPDNSLFLEGMEQYESIAGEQMTAFQKFLLYFLIYRMSTPKSLEAILLALSIIPIWECDPIIWENILEKIDN